MAKIEKIDMAIWKEAESIGVDIYNLTSKGKLETGYSSKGRQRRAAMSISNTIAAEAIEYSNNKVFAKFLSYAIASAGALRNNLFVLKQAHVVDESDHECVRGKLISVSKNKGGFIKYLRSFESKNLKPVILKASN